MIKAVIFDLDGTLIDSQQVVLGAFQHVLEAHGQTYDEAEVKSHVGRVLEHTYKSLAPDHDAQKLALLHRDWQVDRKHLFKGFDGLDTFLVTLKKRGLKLGAYTSASRYRTDAMLEVTGIGKYLEKVICGDEVNEPKPHQEGVVKVAKLMGLTPKEAIMVGDAEHDILSGKNAGAITIGVTHGFGTKEALQKAGADYLVNNLDELLETIKKLT